MKAVRFSKEEAEMYLTAIATYGLPVNANFFSSYFEVDKKRSTELEDIQFDMTEEEKVFLKEVSRSVV